MMLLNVLANFLAYWYPDQFLPSLNYMWKGMLCIFVVIGVIIGSVCLMNFINTKISRYHELLRSDDQQKPQ